MQESIFDLIVGHCHNWKLRVKYSIIHYHGEEGSKQREKQKTKITHGPDQVNVGFVNILVYFSAI